MMTDDDDKSETVRERVLLVKHFNCGHTEAAVVAQLLVVYLYVCVQHPVYKRIIIRL